MSKNMEANRLVSAYESINKNFELEYRQIVDLLNQLDNLSREVDSPLLLQLKPTISIALKWRFDYLSKTLESPFLLKRDVEYWIDILRMLIDLGKQDWFPKSTTIKDSDVWDRTKDAFNYMWPRTTIRDNYAISRQIAELRTNQILQMMDGGENSIKNSIVVDSGCGPGRYTDFLLQFKPSKIIGIDSGTNIIEENEKRFADHKNVEMICRSVGDKLPIDDQYADFVISNGVLHHMQNPIEETVADHARIVKEGGYLFIFIVGDGGLELALWKFIRGFLRGVPIDEMFKTFDGIISPFRMQGFLDHSYGEYQETSRKDLEKYLYDHFREVKRVPGIKGLDVTPEIYENDPYFLPRFGSGNLRYLCKR